MCTEKLAHRIGSIDASGIRKVFALAAELDRPINFSIGQPDFEVPDAIKRAAIEAIEQGFNRYSQTAGEASLREKISMSLTAEFGWPDPGVLVSSGVSGGLLLAFLALVNPGDEVIIPDPYFVIYKHVITMLGGRCVFVDSYPDFSLPIDNIARCISPKTKLIIVNSPGNPTGVVYSRAELEALAQMAQAHNIIVLSDEIYRPFTYDTDYVSMASVYDKTLLLRGFGKAYAVTGWRMGYMAVHPRLNPLLEAMIKIQQYTFVCAPTPFQRAAIAALDVDISPIVSQYRQKRDLVCAELGDDFEFTRPGGAFYVFVKAPQGNATRLVERAIANNVLVIPGNVFSERDTYFRISYATDNADIERGCAVLRDLTHGSE